MNLFDFIYYRRERNFINRVFSSLSQYEIEFLRNFCKSHNNLTTSDLVKLLKDEFPHLYDKINLIISEV